MNSPPPRARSPSSDPQAQLLKLLSQLAGLLALTLESVLSASFEFVCWALRVPARPARVPGRDIALVVGCAGEDTHPLPLRLASHGYVVFALVLSQPPSRTPLSPTQPTPPPHPTTAPIAPTSSSSSATSSDPDELPLLILKWAERKKAILVSQRGRERARTSSAQERGRGGGTLVPLHLDPHSPFSLHQTRSTVQAYLETNNLLLAGLVLPTPPLPAFPSTTITSSSLLDPSQAAPPPPSDLSVVREFLPLLSEVHGRVVLLGRRGKGAKAAAQVVDAARRQICSLLSSELTPQGISTSWVECGAPCPIPAPDMTPPPLRLRFRLEGCGADLGLGFDPSLLASVVRAALESPYPRAVYAAGLDAAWREGARGLLGGWMESIWRMSARS